MTKIECKKAFYVKLGSKGAWESSSIENDIMRIGWPSQKLSDINGCNWEKIRKELEEEITNKGVATRDYRALRMICESTPDDIWVTFYGNYLWWTKVSSSVIYEDKESKYRKVEGWKNTNVNGDLLIINNSSGRISKLQGFRGTVCKVKEVDELLRLINAEKSPEYLSINDSRIRLCQDVERAIQCLHWKDFEILVDLVFRGAGWRRVSVVGETMKFSDIELEDTINNEFYQVQVKSHASFTEFQKYISNFDKKKYRKLFFIVHTPDNRLSRMKKELIGNIELVLPDRLSQFVVDLGLTNWLMRKIQ